MAFSSSAAAFKLPVLLLVLAVIGVCSTSASARHHNCLKLDFGTGNRLPASEGPWDSMRMPVCGGNMWMSINTTELLEEVRCPPSPAPAPATAHDHDAANHKIVCSSSTSWSVNGHDVFVDQFKSLEPVISYMKKRACSKWVEVPSKSGSKVLICADCSATAPVAPPTKGKKGASIGRRGMAGHSGAFFIIIIIFFL